MPLCILGEHISAGFFSRADLVIIIYFPEWLFSEFLDFIAVLFIVFSSKWNGL